MNNRRKLQKAVCLMAFGYVFLHVDITIGVNLLPDWAGYWLLYSALPCLSKEEPEAALLKPLAVVIMSWGLLEWIAAFMGSPWDIPVIGVIINVLALYFHFQLLTNLANTVQRYGCTAQQRILHLRTGRTLLSTASVLPIQWAPYKITVLTAYLIVVVWICLVLFSVYRLLDTDEI